MGREQAPSLCLSMRGWPGPFPRAGEWDLPCPPTWEREEYAGKEDPELSCPPHLSLPFSTNLPLNLWKTLKVMPTRLSHLTSQQPSAALPLPNAPLSQPGSLVPLPSASPFLPPPRPDISLSQTLLSPALLAPISTISRAASTLCAHPTSWRCHWDLDGPMAPSFLPAGPHGITQHRPSCENHQCIRVAGHGRGLCPPEW